MLVTATLPVLFVMVLDLVALLTQTNGVATNSASEGGERSSHVLDTAPIGGPMNWNLRHRASSTGRDDFEDRGVSFSAKSTQIAKNVYDPPESSLDAIERLTLEKKGKVLKNDYKTAKNIVEKFKKRKEKAAIKAREELFSSWEANKETKESLHERFLKNKNRVDEEFEQLILHAYDIYLGKRESPYRKKKKVVLKPTSTSTGIKIQG